MLEKIVFCAFVAFLAFGFLTPTAQAGSIGMNFGEAASMMESSEVAGLPGFEQANWNSKAGATGSLDNLVDASGNPTTVSVSWADSPYARTHPDIADVAGSHRMMRGYLDTDNTTTTKVTISNIPYASYKLVIYMDGNTQWPTGTFNDRNSRFTVVDPSDESIIAGTYVSRDAGVDFNGTFIETTPLTSVDDATTPAGNCVVIDGLSAGTIRLDAKGGYNNDSTSHPRAVVNGIQIIGSSASAHTPTPTGNEVDSTVVNQLTWEGPLIQSDPDGDPNLVSVDQFDLTIYSELTDDVASDDPNFVGVTTLTDVTSPYSITLDYETTYFWRVDTHVTWDSNEFTGTASTSEIVEGSAWQFSTFPEYRPPVIDSFDSVITTLDLVPAALSATISGNSDLVTPTFTLLAGDFQFPDGADSTLTPDYSDPQNPTATLGTDTAGTYKVKLEVVDGTTTLEQVAEVVVYADTCEAKKASPGEWTANEYDKDGDCIVGISDLELFVLEWLDDTGLNASETYKGNVVYVPLVDVPQDVYDARIEANEVTDPTDPNAVSDAPLTTEAPGIRIGGDGTNIGSATDGSYVTYAVDVPAAGTYDLYLSAACGNNNGTYLNFGTQDNPTLYCSTDPMPNTGWGNFAVFLYEDAITFTEAEVGTADVRITWVNNGTDLDWLAIVPSTP